MKENVLKLEKCFYNYGEDCIFVCFDEKNRIIEIHDTGSGKSFERFMYYKGEEEVFSEFFTEEKCSDKLQLLTDTFLKK